MARGAVQQRTANGQRSGRDPPSSTATIAGMAGAPSCPSGAVVPARAGTERANRSIQHRVVRPRCPDRSVGPYPFTAEFLALARESPLRRCGLSGAGPTGRARATAVAVRGRNDGGRPSLEGEHDCKAYLAAYGEALQQCALTPRLEHSLLHAMFPAAPAPGVLWNSG